MLEKQALSAETVLTPHTIYVPTKEPVVQKWHPRISHSIDPATYFKKRELNDEVVCPYCKSSYRLGDGILYHQSWVSRERCFVADTKVCSSACLLLNLPKELYIYRM